MTRENPLPQIHPSEILLEEFLEPMGISQYRLVKDISGKKGLRTYYNFFRTIHIRRLR